MKHSFGLTGRCVCGARQDPAGERPENECPGGDLDAQEVRRLLWLRHGCPTAALYGDDGEMQCGACLVDFKRMSGADISELLAAKGRQLAEHQLADLLR